MLCRATSALLWLTRPAIWKSSLREWERESRALNLYPPSTDLTNAKGRPNTAQAIKLAPLVPRHRWICVLNPIYCQSRFAPNGFEGGSGTPFELGLCCRGLFLRLCHAGLKFNAEISIAGPPIQSKSNFSFDYSQNGISVCRFNGDSALTKSCFHLLQWEKATQNRYLFNTIKKMLCKKNTHLYKIKILSLSSNK